MQVRRLAAAALMALAAACGGATPQTTNPGNPGDPGSPINTDPGEQGDVRGVEEIGSTSALTALAGTPTFNATTGALAVPLNTADKVLIVSQSVGGTILLNGRPVTDPAGVPAVASGSTGVLKSVLITAAAANTTVVLDYLNGYFAPGVTGTFTSSTPIGQGTTVDFGAWPGCSFKIRATNNNDTVIFGVDKTASKNQLVSLGNGNFGDIWVKATSTTTTSYGVSLGIGNDTFNASPGATVLGGMLTPWQYPIAVHGGLGDDTMTGSIASDSIYGDEGNNLVDESVYTPSLFASATTTRQFSFATSHIISATGTAVGSFLTDFGSPTPPFVIMVGGTLLNGTTAAPKFFTVTAMTATSTTVTESLAAEGPVATAVITLVNTTHAQDTVYGLVPFLASATSTTTVTYAARTFGRMANATAVPFGVLVQVGPISAATTTFYGTSALPSGYANNEDNLDVSVNLVIGTDFKDVLWCNNFLDANCTLIGGKGDDVLKAGMSPTSTHKLYGGDGNDSVIMTDNTDNALLMGGNWTDATSVPTATASGTRKFTFSATSTNPGTISATSTAPGSFITDGFLVGQTVTVTGATTGGNNRSYVLSGVTATVLTFSGTSTAADALQTSMVITGPTLNPSNAYQDTVDYSAITATGTTISLNFGYPASAKGFTATPGVNNSGASGKARTYITKDFTKAICPAHNAVQKCTFTGNDLGNWVVAGKGPDVLTGGAKDDTFDLSLADNTVSAANGKTINGNGGSNDSVDFSGRSSSVTNLDISCLSTSAGCSTNSGFSLVDAGLTLMATSTRAFAVDATAKTITATSTSAGYLGSFKLDGFTVGQAIVLVGSGTSTNDATYTLADVTDSVLTLNESPTSTFTETSGATIQRAGPVVANTAGGRELQWDAASKTITATSTSPGDFVLDGFAAGQTILVSGTTSNNGVFTIASLTATTLVVNETLLDEGPLGSLATISRYVFEGSVIKGITNATCPVGGGSLTCNVTGNSNSNILDLNNCTGKVISCGGGSDLVLNASHNVTGAGCGI